MNLDDLKKTVASTFDVPLEQVTEDSSNLTIPQWDSVNHMNLIMALEERFKTSFTVDEILAMRDVAAIRRVLQGRPA